jgi:heme-degrading monooxygenase HmoA
MEVVLIDRFTVPEESKVTFLAEVRRSTAFLRTLPGFVEGFVYENSGGASHNVVTTAVWKDEDAFQNARKKAAEEFQRIGFNPPEITKRLKVETERGVYRRSPY